MSSSSPARTMPTRRELKDAKRRRLDWKFAAGINHTPSACIGCGAATDPGRAACAYCERQEKPAPELVRVDLRDVRQIVPRGPRTCHVTTKDGRRFVVGRSLEELVRMIRPDLVDRPADEPLPPEA